MKKYNPTFGQRLRAARERAGISQTELAGRCHVTSQRINALEQGERPNPRIDSVQKLAAALKITVAELIGEDSPKKVTA